MATVQPPLFIGVNGVIGADELGLPWRDLIGEGVLASGDLAVAQRAAGANMSVDVAAGAAWVKGDTDANAQPTYRVRNDATVNVAIGGADATKPRIDRIVARVYDSAFAGVSLTWTIEVVPGVATAGATLANLTGAAAVPATALLLANVLVPAAASSIVTANLDDQRVRAIAGAGAMLAPNYEIAYAELAAPGITIAATTEGAANNFIDLGTQTYDGATRIKLEASGIAQFSAGFTNGDSITIVLYDSGVVVGVLAIITCDQAAHGENHPFHRNRYFTPSKGSHNYKLNAYCTHASTCAITSGAGGAGTLLPTFGRITRA